MDVRYLAKIKFRDKFARWLITLGGISIIGSMLIMIVFMVKVTLPLFHKPTQTLLASFDLNGGTRSWVALGPGPYLEKGYALSADGTLVFFDLKDGRILKTEAVTPPVGEPARIVFAHRQGKQEVAIFWDDGAVSMERIAFVSHFDQQGNRTIRQEWENLVQIDPLVGVAPTSAGVLKQNDDGTINLVRVLDGSRLFVYRKSVTEDFLGEVTEEIRTQTLEPRLEGRITALELNHQGDRLFAATNSGELLAWNLADLDYPVLLHQVQTLEPPRPLTSLSLLFGDLTLMVGDEAGRLSAWNLVPGSNQLTMLRGMKPRTGGIRRIIPSVKNKSMVSLDARGDISLGYLTSNRRLLTLSSEFPLRNAALAERNDALLALDENGTFWLWGLHGPHPEISWKVLWSKVWYEGYKEPVYAWQSSSASDDFEPKLSLMPLLYGSLKGTFYGMLFSLPLALFSAMYVSHLMNPMWRAIIKPIIELMAAVPSVVIGFLAALWLAPRLENNLLAVIFSVCFIPLLIGLLMWILFKRNQTPTGYEFFWGIPMVLLGVFLAFYIGGWVQAHWFNGNLNLWFFQNWGLSVDQRNCVVIGFALGFAVIPIIFTISEDALFNVPKHLSAAALALGSSRWQTLRYVVLPMASPGIFAAIMIGFGRAVGETMIVLMATGNTAIMSPSILNGMRTLAANIAVEIPEAPVGSTLYRILFFSAVLLFAMTFCINTLAEFVSVRLRKKYKNL